MADGSAFPNAQAAEPESRPTEQTKKAKKVRAVKAVKTTREASKIPFPYYDLEVAVSVVRALLDAGGVPLTREQLAGAIKMAPTGGQFVLKVGAARMYGLIENRDGKFQLTDLGFNIADADEKRAKAARAAAFLNVPLYGRVYEEFKGKPLPPRPHGLEQAFVRFGVPAKQRENARRTFERSARLAGFFAHGDDRLVEPVIGSATPMTANRANGAGNGSSVSQVNGEDRRAAEPSARNHPLIEGLFEILPPPHAVMRKEDREKWLKAAAGIFDILYLTGEQTASE